MWGLGTLPEGLYASNQFSIDLFLCALLIFILNLIHHVGFPAAYAAYAAGRGYSGYPSFGLPYPTGKLISDYTISINNTCAKYTRVKLTAPNNCGFDYPRRYVKKFTVFLDDVISVFSQQLTTSYSISPPPPTQSHRNVK